MGRPIYPYELDDPDFSWLVSKFREQHPESIYIEDTCLPVVLIAEAEEVPVEEESMEVNAPPEFAVKGNPKPPRFA